MSTPQDNPLAPYRDQIIALGLDYDLMTVHAERIRATVRTGTKPQLKVVDTCRLDNGGVIPSQMFTSKDDALATARDFVAFIPAAGAASRYSAPLADLLQALENGAGSAADTAFSALLAEGADHWPLPASISRLIATKTKLSQLPQTQLAELAHDLNLPKALMPCVKDGMSFLAMKVHEHEKLPDLAAEVYVTPPGMSYAFASALAKIGKASRLPRHFLEQGAQLSTLRFRTDGELYLDHAGKPSTVPAGHGALASLFPAAGRFAPKARSLFIRNIDNIMGTGAAALEATHLFLAGHRRVLTAVDGIRVALANADLALAAKFADSLLLDVPARPLTAFDQQALATLPDPERRLWEMQIRLFHASPMPGTRERLAELFRRPVNTVGQVPNTGKDVGGTPCFVQSPGGRALKICVEVPHVSDQDRDLFLANPAKATHFNPVFVAAEITSDGNYYARRNGDFWLLSRKSFRGDSVLYHETVLYELLGNSDLANCMFVEVPRLIFHPHKSLADAIGKDASHWLG